MPKLPDDQRQSIAARLAAARAVREQFEGHYFFTAQCGLCNWASNGVSPDDANAGSRDHQARMHAQENAILEANRLSMAEIQASFHDHDCVMATCRCICGCEDGPFCHIILGPLCGACMLSSNRGDSAHRDRLG